MVTAITVKEKIQGLIAKSNNITGNSDTTLTDAIDALVEGYGSGDGEAVLTELTVTENGVYDQPMIGGGPEPITWDGVAGDRVTVKSGEEMMYTKLSDKVLSVEDLVGSTIVTNNEQKIIVDSTVVLEMGDVILATELVVIAPMANASFSIDSETITFPEAGIYFFGVAPAFYVTSFAFPASEPIPADGWNKVTVNVAGDIIDVPELPTENIEEGKIYRKYEEAAPIIWFTGDIGGSGTPMSLPFAELIGMEPKVTVVEALPDTMEPTT